MTLIKRENWFVGKNHRKPMVECPVCKGWLLGDEAPHRVHPDGKVTASVVCRGTVKVLGVWAPCTFHDYIVLEGWDGGSIG